MHTHVVKGDYLCTWRTPLGWTKSLRLAVPMRLPTILSSSSSKLPNWLLWLRIKELSLNGKWQQVFFHYHELKKSGRVQLTDPSLFSSILRACLIISSRHGKSIHASLVKQGLDTFTSIGNSIMDFYVKSGALDSAMCVFNNNLNNSRDSVSWNIVIHGHLDQGAFEEGLCLFVQGRVAAFEPNIATLVLLIQACRCIRPKFHNHEGLKLHGYIIKNGFWANTSIQNSVLSVYVDTDMDSARKLFDEMHHRDVISWSVMIGGYVQSGEAQAALWVFRDMVSDYGTAMDGQTMTNVLKACISLGETSFGRSVHGFVLRKGFDGDVFVGNSLVDMYFKCNDADSAVKTFKEMPKRNIVSWNSLLSGFVCREKHSEALMVFDSMRKEGIEADEVTLVNLLKISRQQFVDQSECKTIHTKILQRGYELNEFVMNSLIDAYAKCNLIMLALKLFKHMEKRDMVTWSTMIAGFTQCGMPDEAIAIFQEMNQVQEKPNAVTMLGVLEACSISAELKRGKWAHGIAIRRGLSVDVAVGTAILDMYSKCGAVEASKKAFDQISQKNTVSWSAMIAAYGMNGLARDALALLAKMKEQGLKPNLVTSLSVLSACSHGGLVEEGLSLFEEAVQDPGTELVLEHYSCLVDMLGRAGILDTAMDLIKKMPKRLEPGASAWGALLSACRRYGNYKLGSGAASRVLELEPLESSGYMLASNMYAAGGFWVDAARMRLLVKERGVKVVAGYSLVCVDNKSCRFLAGDKSYLLFEEICLTIEKLHLCMKMDTKKNEVVPDYY